MAGLHKVRDFLACPDLVMVDGLVLAWYRREKSKEPHRGGPFWGQIFLGPADLGMCVRNYLFVFVSTVLKERKKCSLYSSVNKEDHIEKYTMFILSVSLPDRRWQYTYSLFFEPFNALTGRKNKGKNIFTFCELQFGFCAASCKNLTANIYKLVYNLGPVTGTWSFQCSLFTRRRP